MLDGESAKVRNVISYNGNSDCSTFVSHGPLAWAMRFTEHRTLKPGTSELEQIPAEEQPSKPEDFHHPIRLLYISRKRFRRSRKPFEPLGTDSREHAGDFGRKTGQCLPSGVGCALPDVKTAADAAMANAQSHVTIYTPSSGKRKARFRRGAHPLSDGNLAVGGEEIIRFSITNPEPGMPQCSLDNVNWVDLVPEATDFASLSGWDYIDSGATFTLYIRDGRATDSSGNLSKLGANTGDLNNDGKRDLADLVLALQILAGLDHSAPVRMENEIGDDDRIGAQEPAFLLQYISRTESGF